MKCVILAAGFGSRMQPFSSYRPKHMLPVTGKPILQYGLEMVRDQLDIEDFIFVVGYLRNAVINHFNSGSELGVNIKYVIQHSHNKRGLAAAIKLVEDHISSDFILYLADNLFETSFKPVIETHYSENADLTILTEHHPNPSRYGVVVLSKKSFEKEWPQKELDGLVSREVGSSKVILPAWHGATREEVQSFSPILADRLAMSSDKG